MTVVAKSELRDNCPNCSRPNVPEATGIDSEHDAVIAGYRCTRCRHGWWTSFDLGAVT